MITAVIFDFYGVICADAYTAWQNSLFAPDDPIREKFSALAAENDLGVMSLKEFYSRASVLAGTPVSETISGMGQAMKIDVSVMNLIAKLRKNGIKTAILSNSPVSLYDTINGFGIANQFDVVLCSGEVGYVKPGREIFDILLKRLGGKAQTSVFVDDRKHNTDAATKLGLQGIMFLNSVQLRTSFLEQGLPV